MEDPFLPLISSDVWKAMFVDGDGNCMWRSVGKALWDSDQFWPQIKLVVLGWAAANAETLVGDEGVLFRCKKFYSQDVVQKYACPANTMGLTCDAVDNTLMMLLESVKIFSEDGQWGGDLTALWTSEALGMTVKLVVPTDMQARKKNDVEEMQPAGGTGRKGMNKDINRISRCFKPNKGQQDWRVCGQNGRVVDEITIALTTGCKRASPDDVAGIPEVEAGTDCSELCHFAAIMTKDNSTRPFPLSAAAPSLFSVHMSVYCCFFVVAGGLSGTYERGPSLTKSWCC